MDWLEIAKVAPTAALVSAIVTLAIRWFDRPRAVLRLEARLTQSVGDMSGVGDGPTTASKVALLNVGDGDAFDVKIFGSKCDPAIEVEPRNWAYSVSVVKAGESAIIIVGTNKERRKMQDAAIIVTWSTRPKRGFRKSLRRSLDEVGRAALLPAGLLPVSEIPPHVWRTRSLERRSPRARQYIGTVESDDEWTART